MGTFQRFRDCKICKGEGFVPKTKSVNLPENQTAVVTLEPETCSKCRGTGKVDIVDDLKYDLKLALGQRFMTRIGLWVCSALCVFFPFLDLYLVRAKTIDDLAFWTYLIVIVVFELIVMSRIAKSKRFYEKQVIDIREKIDLIEHMDIKAKRGFDPEPLYVDGQLVQNVEVIQSPNRPKTNEELLDDIQAELELNTPGDLDNLPDEVGMPPDDTNTLSSNAYQDHLSFWSRLGGD